MKFSAKEVKDSIIFGFGVFGLATLYSLFDCYMHQCDFKRELKPKTKYISSNRAILLWELSDFKHLIEPYYSSLVSNYDKLYRYVLADIPFDDPINEFTILKLNYNRCQDALVKILKLNTGRRLENLVRRLNQDLEDDYCVARQNVRDR